MRSVPLSPRSKATLAALQFGLATWGAIGARHAIVGLPLIAFFGNKSYAFRTWQGIVACLILTSPLTALAVAYVAYHRLLRYYQLKVGRCVACGYDLRGSTGACPECGAERPA